MQRNLAQRVGYASVRLLCQVFAVPAFRVRCWGRSRWPKAGPALVCANHQSFLDPVLVGLCCDRRLNYLARDSLFRVPVLAGLIRFLDAIPLDRDGLGLGGLRESLRRIHHGEMVLIFPEGTRTWTGEVGRLQHGFCALARRGGVSLVPVGIDGAFEAWPRSAYFPRFTRVHVCIGEPLGPEWIRQASDEAMVAELQRRIESCHAEARRRRRT